MAITNLSGRYLQDSFKFVTQNSQSYTNPDKWDFADGEAVPITWINATASWAATASVALGLVDNIWVRSTGSNSAVLNDSSSRISYAGGSSSIAYGYKTTASGDFAQSQGYYTFASGSGSHTEGYRTTASGHFSYAAGSESIALGVAAHVAGLHTIASGAFQTIFGRYNKHNNTDDYFVVGDGTEDFFESRSNALGANATRFYASNSIFFPDLTDSLQQHLVVFDTASKQIFYYTASGLGGGGTTLPGGPNGAIQFNSASTFSGSGLLTYNFNNSQIVLTGSQIIDLSGSNTALQIYNDCSGQSAVLTNLPFLPNNTFRLRPLIYVPSSSADPNIKGQLWFIHEDNDGRPRPTQVFEVTSSNGDLKFKGYIGSSSNPPFTFNGVNGRLSPPAIHASNFAGNGLVLAADRYSNGLVAYNPDKVAAQPDGFTYAYNSLDDNNLYEYISPLTGSDGNGIVSRRYEITVNNISYTPSASIDFYSVFNLAVSKSDASYDHDFSNNPLKPNTRLSASIAQLYAAGLPLSGAADYFPCGFFMSTFDDATATNTQYVDLTTQLLAAGLPKNRIFSGSLTTNTNGQLVMAQPPFQYASFTVAGEYNPDLNKIYVSTHFAGGLHPFMGYVELDNDTSPPTLVGYTTSSLGAVYHAAITYNSNTQDLLIRDNFNTTYKVYDASISPIDWNNPKTIITMPSDMVGGQLLGFQLGTPIASGSDFYLAGGKNTSTGQNLFSIIFESSSTGYAVKTGSLAENWETVLPLANRKATHGVTPIAFGSNINKFFVGNNSEIGPVGDPDTADEGPLYSAKSNRIYSFTPVDGAPTAFNTPSEIVFDPYTYDVSRIGNFVEFIDCAGEVLSYVDANGVFQGTASFASNVLPGGSSIEFYSGSTLQTSNLEGLVISGSYLQSQANGNQVTMSLDLSSLLATFTSQSFTVASNTWIFNHNLNERYPLVTIYDSTNEVVIPQDIIANSANQLQINFSAPTTGYAVAGAGPFTGLTRYPITFYSASTLQTSDLRSLVITGSGVTSTVNGNEVTMSFSGGGGGSANPGGSNTNIQFNYNGNALSGSNNFTFISQSNLVYLTGSLNVSSGSFTLSGSGFITGALNVSGSIFANTGSNHIGFIGTSSWARNVGPGVQNFIAYFSASNSTINSNGIFVQLGTPGGSSITVAPNVISEYQVTHPAGIEFTSSFGSNIAVNNTSNVKNSILILPNSASIVKEIDYSFSLANIDFLIEIDADFGAVDLPTDATTDSNPVSLMFGSIQVAKSKIPQTYFGGITTYLDTFNNKYLTANGSTVLLGTLSNWEDGFGLGTGYNNLLDNAYLASDNVISGVGITHQITDGANSAFQAVETINYLPDILELPSSAGLTPTNLLQQGTRSNDAFGVYFAYDVRESATNRDTYVLRIWCINATGNAGGAAGSASPVSIRVSTQTKLIHSYRD